MQIQFSKKEIESGILEISNFDKCYLIAIYNNGNELFTNLLNELNKIPKKLDNINDTVKHRKNKK